MTDDPCDEDTGCVYEVDCGDENACIDNYCMPDIALSGITDCDDNTCTGDSEIGCEIIPISCDDHGLCTDDFCYIDSGCFHCPICT